ncbi:MAG: DNA polymerase III subunit delta [Puniceicoccales bacterium]|jgi:DNA polymerase-3 subunit delta|nr:DNA polymerase III subunit delta [Puniceicoccales bacterium]
MLESKFFIAGGDPFSIRKRSDSIIQSFGDGEIEVIDSRASGTAEAIQELKQCCEALRTFPLFSERKLVWFRDVTFLGDGVVGRSEGVLEWIDELQRLLENSEGVGCLITAGVVDRRQRTIKWFLEHCNGEILDMPKAMGCERYVLDAVKRERKKINPKALEMFLQRTGNDLMAVDGELNKLLLYLGEKVEIEIRDVDDIVVDLRENDFFETIDSFFGDDRERFQRHIYRYFSYREEGRPLLVALQNRLRLLIQLCYFYEKDGVESITKSTLEDLGKRYGSLYSGKAGSIFTQNPWYLGKLLAIAKKCSLGEWIAFYTELLGAVVELSMRYGQQRFVFEKLYFRLGLAMKFTAIRTSAGGEAVG